MTGDSEEHTNLPDMLSPAEIKAILSQLHQPPRLVASLMYGAGLRLAEAVRLRVRDLDFDKNQLAVRTDSYNCLRYTLLPKKLRPHLTHQLRKAKRIHQLDSAAVAAAVEVPSTLTVAEASRAWSWQYVFPSPRRKIDASSRLTYRSHVSESSIRKRLNQAACAAGIEKRVTGRSLRQSFAVHLLEIGIDPRIVHELLGHRDLRSTLSYVRLLDGRIVPESPFDSLY